MANNNNNKVISSHFSDKKDSYSHTKDTMEATRNAKLSAFLLTYP